MGETEKEQERAECIALRGNSSHKREVNPFRKCFSSFDMLAPPRRFVFRTDESSSRVNIAEETTGFAKTGVPPW